MSERRSGIACIVMASGEGKRFGPQKGGKLLAPLGGMPVLRRVLTALPREKFCDVVVVTRWPEVEAICDAMLIKCVRHDSPLRSAAIREGMKAVIGGSQDIPDGCLFVNGDQPLLTAGSVERLLQAFDEANGGGAPVVCRLGWKQEAGNPVLFPAAMFEMLCSLEGNRGGASLLRGEVIQGKGIQDKEIQVLTVEAGSPYELMDVDSPEDLAKLEAILYFAKIEK